MDTLFFNTAEKGPRPEITEKQYFKKPSYFEEKYSKQVS
jgi:hypothetical protein